QATGEDFRGVVAGGFLAGAASQAVDEAALGIQTRFAAEQAFGVAVLADGADRHEIGGFQRVEFAILALFAGAGGRGVVVIRGVAVIGAVVTGGGFVVFGAASLLGLGVAAHFIQVFFGEEATEGKQRLVHGTELVDAQGGVADAAPATVLAAAATRERHQLDDALQDVVAQLDAVEQPGTGR